VLELYRIARFAGPPTMTEIPELKNKARAPPEIE